MNVANDRRLQRQRAKRPPDIADNPLLALWRRFGDTGGRLAVSSILNNQDAAKGPWMRPTRSTGRWAGRPYDLTWAEARRKAIDRYGFAVPNNDALAAIAKYAPILEVGAGTGYWAHLLQRRGVDVLAVDHEPPATGKNHWFKREWTTIRYGTAATAADHPGRALMLCWPNYDNPLASDALRHYAGATLIYVGEGYGGCTGDDLFHQALEESWTEVEEIHIPQWPGIRDYLTIYRRNTSRRITLPAEEHE